MTRRLKPPVKLRRDPEVERFRDNRRNRRAAREAYAQIQAAQAAGYLPADEVAMAMRMWLRLGVLPDAAVGGDEPEPAA